MLWEIIKKEIRDQLFSLRLMLTFLLILVLMAANAVLFDSEYPRRLVDYNQDVNRSLADLARQNEGFPLFGVFAWNEQLVYRRPSPAGFIAEGHDKDLPNAFKVNAFRLYEPEFTLRGNPLLWRFDSLDWAFVLSVIFSFAAIVLVYDSINGEKERGTLRLMMAQAVPREKILLAKYLSAVMVLLIPLILGTLVSLMVLSLGGSVALDAALVAKVGVSLLLGAVYISLFVLLGMFLSTRGRTPVVSLVTGLLVWVTLVIVIPATGNLLAQGLRSVPMQDRVIEQADQAWEEAIQNYNRRHPDPDNWLLSGRWSPGEPLDRAMEADRAYNRVFQGYQDQKAAQVAFGRRIAAISPAALLTQGLERVASSGFERYLGFLDSARRYQLRLADFLDQNYPLDKVSPKPSDVVAEAVRKVKLDVGAIPKFEDRLAQGSEVSSRVLTILGILALLNLVVFAASYVSFLRYDVR